MQKAEGRMQKWAAGSFCLLHSAFRPLRLSEIQNAKLAAPFILHFEFCILNSDRPPNLC
jgi:hypothetical protein